MYQGVIINTQAAAPPDPPPAVKPKRQSSTLEAICVTSLLLAMWISGLLHPVVSLFEAHRSQALMAIALYLLFRYLGWLPLALLGLLVASPLLALRRSRERRQGPPVARA